MSSELSFAKLSAERIYTLLRCIQLGCGDTISMKYDKGTIPFGYLSINIELECKDFRHLLGDSDFNRVVRQELERLLEIGGVRFTSTMLHTADQSFPCGTFHLLIQWNKDVPWIVQS